eukprot:1754164-Pyramimonas_sp.AAC.1
MAQPAPACTAFDPFRAPAYQKVSPPSHSEIWSMRVGGKRGEETHGVVKHSWQPGWTERSLGARG